MPHMPIKELVAEARALSKQCFDRAVDQKEMGFPYEMAGLLANHADHIEALFNDYPADG